MTLEETVAEIKRQGGLVYVPHPFDRMHAVPDYEHLLTILDDVDAIEVYNPRVAIGSFNEEAERFAAKYRIVAGAGSDSHVAAGPGLGADPDARLRRAGGVPRVPARRRDRHASPPRLLYVQALKFLETKATPAGRAARAPRAAGPAGHAQVLMHGEGESPGPSKAAGRHARDRRRDPREVPGARHPRAQLPDPRAAGLRLPARAATSCRCSAPATRRPTSSCSSTRRGPSEVEEGVAFYGRSGHRADEVPEAPGASTRSPSTGRCA